MIAAARIGLGVIFVTFVLNGRLPWSIWGCA
jgi:hypothetical protein